MILATYTCMSTMQEREVEPVTAGKGLSTNLLRAADGLEVTRLSGSNCTAVSATTVAAGET